MAIETAVSAALRRMQAARLPLQNYFGTREVTIVSKHGSPRSGLDLGLTCSDWLEPFL